MPTYATKTCRRSRVAPAALAGAGFTLLEILVVLTIVAILTGTVVLGFTGADRAQDLKGAAQRLATRFEMARQQALTRNREWGVYIEKDDYHFAEFDPQAARWVIQEARPFATADLPDQVSLRLRTEGVGEIPFAEEQDLPQILLFSSGEITPFSLYLEPGERAPAWLVASDGLSRVTASRDESGA
ncbi:MAG: type II secretion system minor pseudopilin GspH [Pseudomonadales bacterium]